MLDLTKIGIEETGIVCSIEHPFANSLSKTAAIWKGEGMFGISSTLLMVFERCTFIRCTPYETQILLTKGFELLLLSRYSRKIFLFTFAAETYTSPAP